MRAGRVAAMAIVVTALGAAPAYGTVTRPTPEEIRAAKGPITSITEFGVGGDGYLEASGPVGLVFAQENVRGLGLHAAFSGLRPGARVALKYTQGACGKSAGKAFTIALGTASAGGTLQVRGGARTPVRALPKAITLRARAARLVAGGAEIGCGPVVVLRLTNEQQGLPWLMPDDTR